MTIPDIAKGNAADANAAAKVSGVTGKFITFEGIDGAGKSTHISWFAERLREKLRASGRALVVTREPGGTALAEALRELLLNQAMTVETEALLMFAARREHLALVIEPALQRGDWVISDRFTDASFAYQGGGGHLEIAKPEALEAWVHPYLQPDLTVLFDLPAAVARGRLAQARAAGDKFEQRGDSYFDDVRNEYLRRARTAPGRISIIDGAQSIETVRQKLTAILSNLDEVTTSTN